MTAKIYILLPAHNRREVTRRLVECLKVQTFSAYHLVLIDDGSTDGTSKIIRELIPDATVLHGTGNWWWAGSLQQGIDWLKQNGARERDIVMFANDDITFDEDFLSNAANILENLEGTLLLPFLRDEKTGQARETGIVADLSKLTFIPATSPDRINCLPTRGIFMRFSDIRRIGRFHTILLPHYWSDYEYTIRAHRKGLRLHTSSELVINLDHSQTGYRSCENQGFVGFLQKSFSKRSTFNPIYHTTFILLATPLSSMPRNIYKVWRQFLVRSLFKFRQARNIRRKRSQLAQAMLLNYGNLKVIVGSGTTKMEGWISTDYPILDLTDSSSFSKIFGRQKANNFLAEHVWEHLSPSDAITACRNCFTYLSQGGTLRIAVPDGYHPDAEYIEHVRPGGSGPGADDHKVLYNYQTLPSMLQDAGYKVRLLEWFDERHTFHKEEWCDSGGRVIRSTRYDPRNRKDPTAFTSLIVDAYKP